MATKEYATLAQLKAQLTLDPDDDSRDTELWLKLASASRAIDEHCKRRFWIDDEVSARVYKPVGRVHRDLLLVDDIATETGVLVSVGTPGSYTALSVTPEFAPDNAVARGRAITGIVAAGACWPTDPMSRIQVTAKWGWPEVPGVVVEATLIQASRYWKRKDTPEGVSGSSEWGTIRMGRVDPDVASMLTHLVLPGVGS